jgi:hypothetical protein
VMDGGAPVVDLMKAERPGCRIVPVMITAPQAKRAAIIRLQTGTVSHRLHCLMSRHLRRVTIGSLLSPAPVRTSCATSGEIRASVVRQKL